MYICFFAGRGWVCWTRPCVWHAKTTKTRFRGQNASTVCVCLQTQRQNKQNNKNQPKTAFQLSLKFRKVLGCIYWKVTGIFQKVALEARTAINRTLENMGNKKITLEKYRFCCKTHFPEEKWRSRFRDFWAQNPHPFFQLSIIRFVVLHCHNRNSQSFDCPFFKARRTDLSIIEPEVVKLKTHVVCTTT